MYANRLKALRLEHGYTIEEVGKKIGIKKSSYASYESRYRQPPLEKLKSIAQLYGVSVDYILGLSDFRNYEECIQSQFKKIHVNNGLHWDGQDIPDDVLTIIEDILIKALQDRPNENII